MALLDLLEAQGQTEFKEPLPIWREWRSDVIGICDGVVDEAIPEDFDYNKFMRQAPSRRRG